MSERHEQLRLPGMERYSKVARFVLEGLEITYQNANLTRAEAVFQFRQWFPEAVEIVEDETLPLDSTETSPLPPTV